jgi:glycosyltransferase involved in cell wall biosynthesis
MDGKIGASRRNPPQAIKLLCIDQCIQSGGAQKSLLDLLDAFSLRGWQPAVAAPAGSPFAESVRAKGYPSHGLSCGTYSSTHKPAIEHFKYAAKMPQVIRSLSHLVRAHGINLLYVNGSRLFPPAAWVAKMAGIPVVFHIHNRLVQRSAVVIAGRSLKWTGSPLIACCYHALVPLKAYLDSRHVKVLYNGVRSAGRPGRNLPEKLRRIGVVGRVEVEKGQLEFVRAARLLADSHPECRFSVIGRPLFTGAEYYLSVIAASKGVSVDFIDWQDDLTKLYANLDLLVVPSSYVECTTRVVLEAYSAGVPVVAFPSGGIPEILQDNKTGFLAADATAEALAARITSVLRMKRSQLIEVVSRARETWEARYTLETYCESVCEVLSEAATLHRA